MASRLTMIKSCIARAILYGAAMLVALIAAFTGLVIMSNRQYFDLHKVEPRPVGVFRVVIPSAILPRALNVAKDVAAKQQLKFRIGRLHPTELRFAVDLWNDDLIMSGANVLDLDDFESALHVDRTKPELVGPAKSLLENLRIALLSIPGAGAGRPR